MDSKHLISLVDAARTGGFDLRAVLTICTRQDADPPLDVYIGPPHGGWRVRLWNVERYPDIVVDEETMQSLHNEVDHGLTDYREPVKIPSRRLRTWNGSLTLTTAYISRPAARGTESETRVEFQDPVLVGPYMLEVYREQWVAWVAGRSTVPLAGTAPLGPQGSPEAGEDGAGTVLTKTELSRADRKRLLGLSGKLGIVGKATHWLSALRKAELVAKTRIPTLILGETGTGKEEVAKFIRAVADLKPWMSVNCATLRGETARSELFGHVKGAFSGATASKLGFFRSASGGGLFLDEIGETPMEAQAELLRALEEGKITPVGSTDEHPVKVHVVAATNRDLKAFVAQKKFRDDLYQRLNGFTIRLPSLRDRREDVPELARHFLKQAKLPPPALCSFLRAQRWPGNVRELQHAMRGAATYADGAPVRERHVREWLEGRWDTVVPAPGLPREAVDVLSQDGRWMSSGEIAKPLGEESRRVRDALQEPVESGQVETDGDARGRKYRIKR